MRSGPNSGGFCTNATRSPSGRGRTNGGANPVETRRAFVSAISTSGGETIGRAYSHAKDRLAHGTERPREEKLWKQMTVENIRGFAENDGVDVVPVHAGVGKRTLRRLPRHLGEAHVEAMRELGLTDSDHRCELRAHFS